MEVLKNHFEIKRNTFGPNPDLYQLSFVQLEKQFEFYYLESTDDYILPFRINIDRPVQDIVKEIKQGFNSKEIKELNELGIERINFELNVLERKQVAYFKGEEGVEVNIAVPYTTYEGNKQVEDQLVFNFKIGQDIQIECKSKQPVKYNQTSIFDYLSQINEFVKRKNQNTIQRKELIKQLAVVFKDYLLEYDESFLSLFIHMPLNNQILASSVVNIHVGPNFPKIAPVVVLTSSIFIDGDYKPKSTELKYKYKEMPIEQLVETLNTQEPPLPEKPRIKSSKSVVFQSPDSNQQEQQETIEELENTEELERETGLSSEELFTQLVQLYTLLSSKVTALHSDSNSIHTDISKINEDITKISTFLLDNQVDPYDTSMKNSVINFNNQLNVFLRDIDRLKSDLSNLENLKNEIKPKQYLDSLRKSMMDNKRISVAQPQNTPKLFAKLPKQIAEAQLEKPELMRLSAVYELIETEIDYVKDLNTMLTVTDVQMKDCKLIPEKEMELIFSNIDQLLNANQILMNKLTARRDENLFIECVGDLIADSAESFNVYCIYAANYPAAMKLIYGYQSKPDIKELLQKWMNAPEVRGLSLESFLIKPVQRICKYPLLIRELEKYSERAGNMKDKDLLRNAAEKIEAVVTKVNEATRAAEEKQRILNIGSTIDSPTPLELEDKVHLRDGTMLRISNGKPKDRYIILFTDLILICKPIPQAVRGPPRYELESGYSLAELIFVNSGKETIKGFKGSNLLTFNIISEEKDSLVLATANPDDLPKWVEAFHIAFKDITEEHRAAVRSMDTQMKQVDRNTLQPDLLGFGRTTLNKAKVGKSGLSSVAMRKNLLKSMESNINTKESMWKLPPDFVIIGADEVKAVETPPQEQAQVESEEDLQLEVVEGFSNWRKVDRGDGQMPYYFHIQTQETRWEPPTSN
ncbi:Myosin 10A, isoform D [Boothiomyces sp. JEL0866]|nr:Myosin 10A, isoform D [Boothiomyces sp. JEL0866]